MEKLPENPRGCWRTPREIIDALKYRFDLTLDAASDGHNSVCDEWITREQDAFSTTWHGPGVYCNPPFGGAKAADKGTFLAERPLRDWVRRGFDQAEQGFAQVVVMMVACQPANRWFRDFIRLAPETIFLSPRISFLPPDGIPPKGGNRGDNAIFIFGTNVPRVGAWWWDWQADPLCSPPDTGTEGLHRRIRELEAAEAARRSNWDYERKGLQDIIRDLKAQVRALEGQLNNTEVAA